MKIPRLVIAGTHSGVGKTTITSGIMRALTNRGLKVQGFKVGPDYIDPSYHTIATKRFSRNLDSWLLTEETILELMERSSQDVDIAIIEGVMGFYDGFGGNSDLGSTAHIAKITKSPVILIVDARSMARSIAALVYGYCNFDPEVNIAGIILNKVASKRHLDILKEALEPQGIPILGAIFRDNQLGMPERHLGLIPAVEMANLETKIDHIARVLQENIIFSDLVQIAKNIEEFAVNTSKIFLPQEGKYDGLKIGYAYDRAFSFYYRDGLDLLENYGVDLIPISPLEDTQLPVDLAGIILGGGFPELFLEQLSANLSFSNSLKKVARQGIPIYAECGGFMYLTEKIINFTGQEYEMVGLIPGKCKMNNRLVSMGYREGQLLHDALLGPAGFIIKGHEFHYSLFEPNNREDFTWAYSFNNKGKTGGYVKDNLLASYLHLHFLSNPQWVKNFLNICLEYKGD